MNINKKIIKGVHDSLSMEIVSQGDITLSDLDSLEVWIKEKAKLYLNMLVPREFQHMYNESLVVSEVIVQVSKFTPETKMMSDPKNHVPWLTSERKSKRHYWDSYENSLLDDLEEDSVSAIDDVTDLILGELEDPDRADSWDRRGLVVGHVQSGKTSNYTGLIAKAADAGYKIIIVLAGMHNNLRTQTQIRLESGFLGYETDADGRTDKIIGVGQYRDSSCKPNAGTYRTERGDFNKSKGRTISTISPETQPWIFVVKKNKSTLEALIKWIRDAVSDSRDTETGRKIVTKLPLLLVDDEADNASIDTKQQYLMYGIEPDPEHDPTTINRLIRQLLHSFSRKAYVGYTATPFANVFIHEKAETASEGRDLFPSSFIVNLEAPSNYVGPKEIFSNGQIDLFVRSVKDNVDFVSEPTAGWMPNRHRSNHVPMYMKENELPPTLKEAIHSFIIASSVRHIRGDKKAHCSMLVHVTRFNMVQETITNQLKSYLKTINQKITRGIGKEALIEEMRVLWVSDFQKTTAQILPSKDPQQCEHIQKTFFIKKLPEWSEVKKVIESIISDFKILTINGRAKEALEYDEYKELGLKVIAIGGDKLSRGLTLEGLSTSYFLRASRMYDTLMQMGRWFGYRTRYFDLCRIYTGDELSEWFSKIALANEELREEFNLMSSLDMRPHEFGLKVQSHPGLLITSPLKMTNSETLLLSFSGNTVETIAFHANAQVIKENFIATEVFLSDISKYIQPISVYRFSKEEFRGESFYDVPASYVSQFLSSYRSHKDACKANTELLSSFISEMNRNKELTNWTVILLSGDSKRRLIDINGSKLHTTRRKPNFKSDDKVSIGRLLDPKHELIDVSIEQYNDALAMTISDFEKGRTKHKAKPEVPRNKTIRYIKGHGGPSSEHSKENGLLLLYVVDTVEEYEFTEDTPQIGLGIVFPDSTSGVKVPYAVNSVFESSGGHYEL